MELSKLKTVVDADTFDFELRHPETNVLMCTLVLAGPTHPNMLAWQKGNNRRLSQATKRTRDFQKAMTTAVTEILDDEGVDLEREIEMLMCGTTNWRGVEQDSKPLPYDAKIMEGWYRDTLWLRKVVKAELVRAENFTRSSASK